MRRAAGAVAATLFGLAWAGCSSDVAVGTNFRSELEPGAGMGGMTAGTGGTSAGAATLGGAAGSTGGTASGGAAGVAGAAGCTVAFCGSMVYDCGNCQDDDEDGTTDADDVHCTGPCDNSEASFGVDIPGGNSAPCKQDCFFDGDTGSGNDGCNWSHRCDPLAVVPDYPPSGDRMCAYDENASIPGMSATCADLRVRQDPMCGASCGPFVPNGCDCFGCCELPAGSGSWVWLGSGDGTCTIDALDEPSACRPCTPVEPCLNPCDECEFCVGRTTVADSCDDATHVCPTGMAACGPGVRCPENTYCITGCCVPEPT